MHFDINKLINWSNMMDWVVFCSCLVLLTGVIIDIVKSVKSNKELSNEHKSIKEDQKDLSSDNEKVKDLIRSENKNTQQNIEKAQKSLENNDNQIYSLLNNVDKMLIKEIERSKYKYENLTDEQRSIKNYVESINNLMKEVERLQTLSVEQQKQILELQSELNQAQHFNNNFTQHM